MTLYWAEWKDRQGRWHREDGWATREAAERSARFYRRDRHAAARVVVYVDGIRQDNTTLTG